MNISFKKFRCGAKTGVKPYLAVMSRLLIAILMITALELAGVEYISLGKAMAEPNGALVVFSGAALMLAGAAIALAVTVQAWWRLFTLSGWVGQLQSESAS